MHVANQTVSAIAVIDLANELINNGVIGESDLADMGSHFLALYDAWRDNKPIQEYRLPEALLIDLWQQTDAQQKDSDIGLNIGSNVNLQSKGVLATWLSQCSTLAEAFSTFSQNISLLNPSEHWHSIDEGHQIKLVVRFSSPEYPSIAIDRSMSALLSWSQEFSKEGITPLATALVRPAPESQKRYHSIFGNNVLFGQPENCLWLSKEVFSQTIKEANPYLKELVAKQAMALNEQLSNTHSDSVLAAVNKLLIKNLAHFCQVGATCAELYVSRSTLYRRLKKEGTSFTKLVKKARLNALKNNELCQISHDELAEKLGFQDIGSYYRFRKQNN
ncbi:AraC family transcriptional regulator [Alkalimarinus coralli]|uniref:AraC family transcriptional regulator n=1 Tax=Alkalimarinus coralli TaxID=2935863 RepID=UPI00202AFF9A|nr:AraC family transcriptional regulator [Alkalimarinus coralli]